MILESDRRTEERHETVAKVLIDRALVAVDGLRHELQHLTHELMETLRVDALRDRRGIRDVGEQHRYQLPLSDEGAPRGEDLLDEIGRRVCRP